MTVVKSINCFFKGPGFNKYLHSGSQQFATPVPRDLIASSGLHGHCTVIHTAKYLCI